MPIHATPQASPGKSLTAQAFERLRTDILAGRLQPGERLRIQALSERYQIGATAIREALSRLVTDGLVAVEDQRGFNVVPVSEKELLDLTRTRIRVEQMALAMAVEHGDVEWESLLVSRFHRLSRTPPPTTQEHRAAWSIAHRQFHEALIVACDSQWTIRLCALLYDKSEFYRNLAEQRPRSGSRDIDTEHRQLMEAAMARDTASLCRLIAEHFQETTHIILASAPAGLAPAGGMRRDALADTP